MAVRFLDTSALVKLYVREPGTEAMVAMASRQAGHRLVISTLARAELASALARRERAGDLPVEQSTRIWQSFQGHLASRFLTHPVGDPVVERAIALIHDHGLRAYDGLQLASAIHAGSVLGEAVAFVCADQALCAAAEAERLEVIKPKEVDAEEDVD